MTLTIDDQQDIAEELLHKLEIIDPLCILAGGAPRDWFLGNTCNDLDFYVHIKNEQMNMTALRFKRLGLTLRALTWDTDGRQYKCMEHLHRIYEGTYKGMTFQVMIMTLPTTESVVAHFGTSVCKAWWKGKDSGVQPTVEFLLSHYCKYIFKKEDYTAKVLHVDKMIKKFPDYNVLDYSSLEGHKDVCARSLDVYPSEGSLLRALKHKFDNKLNKEK